MERIILYFISRIDDTVISKTISFKNKNELREKIEQEIINTDKTLGKYYIDYDPISASKEVISFLEEHYI
jgi:hypothetical protein